jgi:hypothetical protein
MRLSLRKLLLTLAGLGLAGSVHATEFDLRLKWFTAASALPSHDVLRSVIDTPSVDSTADMRMMFRHDVGPVRFLVDHSTIMQTGDAVFLQRGPDAALDQTVIDDESRWVDLTWEIEDGDHHQSLHRLDRLAVQVQQGNWGVTVGRQAVSWGSGMVFQPMDPFNPFSPTVVDKDYKAGNDLVLVDRLLANGQDLQFLHVVRRDDDGHVTSEVSSTALKWHGYVGSVEFELIGAQHYDERFVGGTLRLPVGEALLRSDVVAIEVADEWRVSGLVNIDYSFGWSDYNGYVFAEYFYNDFGVDELPDNPALLPPELRERLERGEVFNLMRDYIAVGASMQWHPLVNHSVTFITNLHDASSLFQTSLSYSPSDHQTLQAGWVEPLGGRGDEFGGVPVFRDLADDLITTGGASRVFLRWVYYL